MKVRQISNAIVIVIAITSLFACGGPSEPVDSRPEVEAAVERHLAAKTDLDLTNMAIEVLEVDYAEETASALVRIQARDNPDALMELRYELRRGPEGWEVVERERPDGDPAEPPSGHPPVDGSDSEAPPDLPPGHPPVNR